MYFFLNIHKGAPEIAFSRSERMFSSSKSDFCLRFLHFWGLFAFPNPDLIQVQIRIRTLAAIEERLVR
jgi:hypothetical protein